MAESGKLSFSRGIAQAKQEAAGNAGHPATPAASSKSSKKFYFHSNFDTFRFLLGNGKKIAFKNHFFITDDVADAEEIRKNLIGKPGNINVLEVEEKDYDKSTIVRQESQELTEQAQNSELQ